MGWVGGWLWVVSKPILVIIHKLMARLTHFYINTLIAFLKQLYLWLSWIYHRTLSKEVRVQYSPVLARPFLSWFLLVRDHHISLKNIATIPSRYFLSNLQYPHVTSFVKIQRRHGTSCVMVQYHHGTSCVTVHYRHGTPCVTVLYRHGTSCVTVLYRHLITT